MIVVPDSIEPYIGYKALTITPAGQLSSPTYDMTWPVKKRAEAHCPGGSAHWQWVATKGDRPEIVTSNYYQTTSSLMLMQTTTTKPTELPPPGHHWSYELVKHKGGEQSCTCGIYVVEKIEDAFGYVRRNTVLCEIALWGQVTIGGNGARGQYAYPQKMFVPSHLADVATLIAELYEIPTEEQTFTTGREPSTTPRMQWTDPKLARLQQRKDARTAAYGFGFLSLLLLNLTGAFYKLEPLIALAPGVLLILALAITLTAFIDSRKE